VRPSEFKCVVYPVRGTSRHRLPPLGSADVRGAEPETDLLLNLDLSGSGRNAGCLLRTSYRCQPRARTQALAEVGLEEVSERLVEDLSGGQQQRVAVARGLIGQPDLVLADESTSELDAENRANVIALLARRARDGGMVIASSDDSDLLDACDRIFDLANGRLTPISPKVQP